MNRPRPKARAMRERILTVLDHAAFPTSTSEIVAKVGEVEDHWVDPRVLEPPRFLEGRTILVRPAFNQAVWRYLRPAMHMDVYPQLVALEKLGILTKIRIEGMRSVYWDRAIVVEDSPASLIESEES